MTAPHDVGALCVLAGLPRIGRRRLRLVLRHHEPADAVRRLASGAPLHPMVHRAIGASDLATARAAAAGASIAEATERCISAGVVAVTPSNDRFPSALVVDPDPPAVLFVRGEPARLAARRVGVVGTRNATAGGLATAREIGEALGAVGVVVVSGLARGIDAAAHAGVRRSGGVPVAVVGSGPDVPYPRRNTELWEWVAGAGVLISEFPPGTPPDAWRFPQRNRILAALCEVLIVVESRERGGSLITAREALERGVDVMAVPGSPRSRASAGTNQLLVDGAGPLTSVADVLAVLGLDHRRDGAAPYDPRPRPDATGSAVLDACRELGPATLDAIVETTGLTLAAAAMAAARLERSGWLLEAAGWFEVAGSRLEAE
jgi:DNA processing protein